MKTLSKLSHLPFFLVFIKYDYFPIVAVLFIVLQYKELLKIEISKFILKIYFLLFLILRFFSGFDLRIDSLWVQLSQKNYSLSGKFIDIQSVFWAINCNAAENGEYSVIGMNQVMNCPHTVSYGPLFEVLGFKNNPAISTFVFVLLIFTLIYLYYEDVLESLSDKYIYIFTLFLMSPPVNFLIERMNFDIFIFVSIYLIYKKINNNFLRNSLIFILALLKYYPIFLILGSFLFNSITKNYKSIKNDIFFLGLSLVSYLYVMNENFALNQPVRPFRPDRTFGLLSEAINFQNAFQYDVKITYFGLLLLLLIFIFIVRRVFSYSGIFENEFSHNLLIMFFCLSMFANYDYRLAFMVMVIPLMFSIPNKFLFYSILLFLFSSPGTMHSYGNLIQIIENYFIIYIDIPFYFLLATLLIEYFQFLKSNLDKLKK